MDLININNNNKTSKLLKLKLQAKEVAKEQKKKKTPALDPLILAWYALHQAVQTSIETANIYANALEVNAVNQNTVINEEAHLNFVVLKTKDADGKKIKITQKELEKVTTENEEINAERGFFESQATVLKQNAQMKETDVNTKTQITLQTLSEASGLMQMLNSLTNQISRI